LTNSQIAPIELLLMDVDGVLTDGRYFHFPDADGNLVETKGFDSQESRFPGYTSMA